VPILAPVLYSLIHHPPHHGKEFDMHVIMARTAVPMLLILALGALSYAGEPPRPPASSAPSIEGTYQLISRQLADGTRLSPPASMGLNTYTKRHRTFNRVLKDATGKFFSSSNVSTYTLTATEYSETRLFSVLDDQIGGKDTVYNLSSETRSAPVTVEGGRIQFKDPFSTRVLAFEGNKMTATAENNANVVDTWEKVE
jgi:hypothetical protein